MSKAMSERVYLLDGEPVVLAEFLEQEFDDDLPEEEGMGDTRAQILELQPGGVVMIGGGAAHLFELRCVAAATKPPAELGPGNMTGIGELLAPFTREHRSSPFPPSSEVQKLEALYRQTVAGLRQLGHGAAAEVLEDEQFLLCGNPDAPQPLGILTAPRGSRR